MHHLPPQWTSKSPLLLLLTLESHLVSQVVSCSYVPACSCCCLGIQPLDSSHTVKLKNVVQSLRGPIMKNIEYSLHHFVHIICLLFPLQALQRPENAKVENIQIRKVWWLAIQDDLKFKSRQVFSMKHHFILLQKFCKSIWGKMRPSIVLLNEHPSVCPCWSCSTTDPPWLYLHWYFFLVPRLPKAPCPISHQNADSYSCHGAVSQQLPGTLALASCFF